MKATPTIEFTFESPCPGQLENLVALDVGGDDAVQAAATRAHVATCPRCRAFRDSLKTQNHFAHRWFADHPVPKRGAWRAPQREDLGLTPWLNDALKVRSERALATDLWRLAAAVYRMDPEVDRQTVFEDEVVRGGPGEVVRAVMSTMSSGWIGSDRKNRRNRIDFARVHDEAAAIIGALRASDRITSALRLLAMSDRIAERPFSRSLLLQSEIEWHDGADARTTELLENAYRESKEAIHHHDAMNNLAVWAFTKSDFAGAKRLALRAIAADPASWIARSNLAIWSYALGQRRLGDSMLPTRGRGLPTSTDSCFLERTAAVIRRVESRVGRPPGTLDFVLDRLVRLQRHGPIETHQVRGGRRGSP
jgi:hypothetical protein